MSVVFLCLFVLYETLRCDAIEVYVTMKGDDSMGCGEYSHPCRTMKYVLNQDPEQNEFLFIIPSDTLGQPPVNMVGKVVKIFAEIEVSTTWICPDELSTTPLYTVHSTNLTIKSMYYDLSVCDQGMNPFLCGDDHSDITLERVHIDANSGKEGLPSADPFIVLAHCRITVQDSLIGDYTKIKFEKSQEESVACAWKHGCIELTMCEASFANTSFDYGVYGFIYQKGGSLVLKNDTFATYVFLSYSDFRRTVYCENEGAISISSIVSKRNRQKEVNDLWMDIGKCKLAKNENPDKYVFFHTNITSVTWRWWSESIEMMSFVIEGNIFSPCRTKVFFKFTTKDGKKKTVIVNCSSISYSTTELSVNAELSMFGGARNVSVQMEYPSSKGSGSGTDVSQEYLIQLPEMPKKPTTPEDPKNEEPKRKLKPVVVVVICFLCVVVAGATITVVVVLVYQWKRKRFLKFTSADSNTLVAALNQKD
ncbi:uncharacterized protein MONOS_4706 [Monocercomonoides exilis]|uniref:uncharacterized protein n=1 Tax=Monocercomonoides exilis TaxID=2049356 RepID=UPI00355ABE88|nr:hypothetical protein MONOS_4706 [Monocercomonoides exilis]|eukprot:MONOS_4706.1-p1 / transcript=MONOS_4706.1 / gene=MONOS_4706 / organism=Monocercomonoides_exilis_PA203 / gene_product=unspecified product / transcript_product=unspecified product / location=Mono_scaffold00128:39350-40783(+) / protein_length=478 / sequence_SO=supercontig / SO=protein_coding / is_pseudo=false